MSPVGLDHCGNNLDLNRAGADGQRANRRGIEIEQCAPRSPTNAARLVIDAGSTPVAS